MRHDDFNWFVDNYDELYKKYGESYLAIKDRHVLAAYQSLPEALKETQKTEEPGSFIVQKCDGTESAYTSYIASFFVS